MEIESRHRALWTWGGLLAGTCLIGLKAPALAAAEPVSAAALVPAATSNAVRDTVARTPDGCAAIHVVITATTVSAAYPDLKSCGAGVVLRPAGPVKLERGAKRWRLTLRVAWLNTTGAPMEGARRLILAPDSGIVLLPIASYGVDPTPVNGTGVIGGAFYWNVGGATTMSGTIGLDALVVLDIPVGTEQLLLRFGGEQLAPSVGRPPVPSGWYAPTDATLAVVNTDAEGGAKVYLTFLAVRFNPTATADQVRAALRSQRAIIVGGSSGGLLGVPSYLVQIPNPGSFEGLKAVIVALAAEPGVTRVGKQYYGSTIVPRTRSPARPR
ncbi:MAG: hypothetical protein IPJ11_01005 [Gemmatimonadetes bacterium]|nr:hypothetical protein [Gemmatimonadota bacterium]